MRHNKWIWMLIIASIIGVFVVYPSLPNQIPMHWNINGEVDRYGDRSSVFFLAFLPAILYVAQIYLPKIDPKRENYAKHGKAYSIISISIVLALLLFNWVAILAAMNKLTKVNMAAQIVLGILFIIIGNYMTQLRFNYFTGIRLPWTLASEVVWKKTHRAGGAGFIIVGVISIVTSFLAGKIGVLLTIYSMAGMLILVTLYSYVLYRKELKIK